MKKIMMVLGVIMLFSSASQAQLVRVPLNEFNGDDVKLELSFHGTSDDAEDYEIYPKGIPVICSYTVSVYKKEAGVPDGSEKPTKRFSSNNSLALWEKDWDKKRSADWAKRHTGTLGMTSHLLKAAEIANTLLEVMTNCRPYFENTKGVLISIDYKNERTGALLGNTKKILTFDRGSVFYSMGAMLGEWTE